MSSPKDEYLSGLESAHGHTTADAHYDFHRPPSHFTEAREREVHAPIMRALFKGKIDMPVEQWAQYLENIAEYHPEKSYAVPGHTVSAKQKDGQYMLALLAGQSSGKSAILNYMQKQGTLNPDQLFQMDTQAILRGLPELQSLPSEVREAAIPRVRDELLYLQQLATNIALANGLSPVLDIHIIEEEHAKALTDAARAQGVPSILVSPHVDMDTYADRVHRRAVEEGRGAFKPDHMSFHQILADNFENHFRHQFDAGMVIDNNQPFKEGWEPHVIYRFENRDGQLHEQVLDADAYARFKAKAHMVPHVINQRIENARDQAADPDAAIGADLHDLSGDLTKQATYHKAHMSAPAEDRPSVETAAGRVIEALGLSGHAPAPIA